MAKSKPSQPRRRKFVHRSFRERVDSINIDPIRDLARKPYQDTSTSFFIATLDHYREINLSENFTDLVDVLDPVSNSLTQVVFHQKTIFDALEKTLLLNDAISLEPTLELLSQFCHDLGPDFLPFYDRTLQIVNSTAATQKDAEALENIFNCLAYIFKYLARVVCKDLVPTFNALLPLLDHENKDYLTKFAAQALSFLVRKASTDSVSKFIDRSFEALEQNEEGLLHSSLVTVYSQALTGASGTLFSKARLILRPLTRSALQRPCSESVLADVSMEVLQFADSKDNAKPLYDTVLEIVDSELHSRMLDYTYLTSVVQLFISLTFAQSGTKIPSWPQFAHFFETVYEVSGDADGGGERDAFAHSMAVWGALLLRNAEPQAMVKFHPSLFKIMAKLDGGSKFLAFLDYATSLSQGNTIMYAGSSVTSFVRQNWKDNYKAVGYFLALMKDKEILDNFSVVVSPEFTQFIVGQLDEWVKNDSPLSDDQLADCTWRVKVLENTKVEASEELLVGLFNLIQKSSKQPLAADLCAAVLGSLCRKKLSDTATSQILQSCQNGFSTLSHSVPFLQNFYKLLTVSPVAGEMQSSFLSELSTNLTSSDRIREQSLNCIVCLLGDSCPDYLISFRTIQQVPRGYQTARDIESRFRTATKQFQAQKTSAEMRQITANFLFGQLTVKFSPSWNGVFGFVKDTGAVLAEQLWTNAYRGLSTNYEELEAEPYFEFSVFDSEDESLSKWLPEHQQLVAAFQTAFEATHKFDHPVQSLLRKGERETDILTPSKLNRQQAISLLGKVPFVAESHFESLLDYTLGENVENWSPKDRLGILELTAHFRNLGKAPGIEWLKEHLLELLMNKDLETQKLALKCLLNLHNPVYSKYKDNMESLLDKTLFRDEVIQFLRGEGTSTLSTEDADIIIPLVLRILFGRALAPQNGGGAKQSHRTAAVSTIQGMSVDRVKDYLRLSFHRLEYQPFFESGSLDVSVINLKLLRTIKEFILMGTDVTDALRKRHSECLAVMIEPLVYSLTVSDYVIAHPEQFSSEVTSDKTARANRKDGFNLLYKLTDYLGEDYDWSSFRDSIYHNLIRPKMPRFAQENLQGNSSLTKLMTFMWPHRNMHEFLYYDDFLPAKALLEILPNPNAKDPILLSVLQFVQALVESDSQEEQFVALLIDVISTCLDSLVAVFENTSNGDVRATAVTILLSFSQKGYVTDSQSKGKLISSLGSALAGEKRQFDIKVERDVLRILQVLVKEYECPFEESLPLYRTLSGMLANAKERNIRVGVSEVFESLGERFSEIHEVCAFVASLNSYAVKRIQEPDYQRRLKAFREINDVRYADMSALEWLPVLNCALFYIDDEEDQSMRTSASYMLMRFVDCYSAKEDGFEDYTSMMSELVIPKVKVGIRKQHELVRMEYIKVVDHVTSASRHFTDLADMQVLQVDEEHNFFENIIHLQVSERQGAVKQLVELCGSVSGLNIAHYLLPIIEHYAFCTEDKYRPLADDTIPAIEQVARHLSWHQFRAIFLRYSRFAAGANAKQNNPRLRDSVRLVVAFTKTMRYWFCVDTSKKPKDCPKSEFVDSWVVTQVVPSLKKLLRTRDEDTVIFRVPLAEAMAYLVTCCTPATAEAQLPGVLTTFCQMLRSRSEELRDAVRKHLGRITVSLGSTYLKFVFKELKGALTRGPQVHILGFTVHYLLTTMQKHMEHGDLDESAPIIMESVMEDLFGAAADEKEADGYSGKTKEIRHNKSLDTGELLAENIDLKDFAQLLEPARYLLTERLSYKAQMRLDELLRRFSVGVVKNSQAGTKEMLVLCYQIHHDAVEYVEQAEKKREEKRDSAMQDKEDYFMVHLDSRARMASADFTAYLNTMRKFAFELLRAILGKNPELCQPGYLSQFIPDLVDALSAPSEDVIMSSLKVFTILARLSYSDAIEDQLVTATRRVLAILEDMPDTENDLAQASLRFLGTVIREKEQIELKPATVGYVLKKVSADLDSPERQGVAFRFLRALLWRHYLVPEIYDTMEVVSKLMVTSTAPEIRSTARGAFYTFLMEYDQSRGLLEKQFKKLINNLRYPAESGRQSVMELINTIVTKTGKDLLQKLFSSFFMALANVAVTDNSPTCREMASEVISSMLVRMDKFDLSLEYIEKYVSAWLKQGKNEMLTRCGLSTYKTYISSLSVGHNEQLDKLALDRITATLQGAKKSDEDEEDNSSDVDWQLVYLCLSTFETIGQHLEGGEIMAQKYESIWLLVAESLLYPHSWVRLSASRQVGIVLQALTESPETVKFDVSDQTLQTLGYRMFRQLSAPKVSQKLANQVAKNLVWLSRKWEHDHTAYIDESGENKFTSTLDWAVHRSASILRNESRPNRDMLVTKKAIIQYCAFLTSFLDEQRLCDLVSEQLLIPLINIAEQEPIPEDDQQQPLPQVAVKCMDMISAKLGVSKYNEVYSAARKVISERRSERKTRKAQLGIVNPEAAARRKIKKHMRFREKRKNNKDENGLYKAKRRRV